MPKSAAVTYACQGCGAVHPKWSGKCDACGEWNTLQEETPAAPSRPGAQKKGRVIQLSSLSAQANSPARGSTHIAELDRVLGGGLVPGSATLIGGDPGIGKSTLLLQAAAEMAQAGSACLYITGEESVDQVRLRARRLGFGGAPVQLAAATMVGDILATLEKEKPDAVIVDSIQTMFVETLESAPGTVGQVRMSAHELITAAKRLNTALLLVGHVTKDGQIAGPRVLEHMVDTVLYFEGERGHQFRIVRAVKNRFGPASEIGVFEMTDKGLAEVQNPSSLFISGRAENVSGSAIFAGMEGTRPMLVEIQALVAPSFMASPRRAAVGWDANRLAMILAVLQTRCSMQFSDKEVYLNVAGGLRISEPAADLAAAAALVSALANVPLPKETAIFGEIGLSGEIRPVSQPAARLKEAQKLGFTKAIIPAGSAAQIPGIALKELHGVAALKSLLSA